MITAKECKIKIAEIKQQEQNKKSILKECLKHKIIKKYEYDFFMHLIDIGQSHVVGTDSSTINGVPFYNISYNKTGAIFP